MLRTVGVLGLACLAFAQNVDDFKAYTNVAEWTGNINYSLQSTHDYGSDPRYKGGHYEHGTVVFHLDQFNIKTGTTVEWFGMGSVQAWRQTKAGTYRKDSSFEGIKGGSASFPSKGWLLMDFKKGYFKASSIPVTQPVEETLISTEKGKSKSRTQKSSWTPQTGHLIHEETLPKPIAGMILSGNKTDHDRVHVNIGDPKAQLDFTTAWTFAPVWRDIELVVTIDDYEKWLPDGGKDGKTPGNITRVHAELRSKDGKPLHLKARKIAFELLDTSKEPGVCLNWPPASKDDTFDLKFLPDTSSLPEDDKFQKVFSVGDKMTRASAVVGSYDYGAWADLRATAELDDGRIVVGHLDGQPDKLHVPLPKRQSSLKAADAWKTDHGHPLGEEDDWDEDGIPKPAKVKGDGLTLYEEYRGVFLQDGKHRRLDPDRMELFVLDPDKLVDVDLWKKISGSAALVLTEDQHLNERVNFNSGSRPKYAVRLGIVNGIIDPEGLAQDLHHWGDTRGKIADETTKIRVFVDRPDHGLRNVFHPNIKKALADPQSPAGKALYGEGIDKTLLEGADRALSDPAVVRKLVGRLVNLSVVHELSHACDADDHPAPPAKGDIFCVMRNLYGHDKIFRMAHELITPSTTSFALGIDRLCSAPDDCWGRIRLKPK